MCIDALCGVLFPWTGSPCQNFRQKIWHEPGDAAGPSGRGPGVRGISGVRGEGAGGKGAGSVDQTLMLDTNK